MNISISSLVDLKSNDRPSRKTFIVYQEQKTPTDINVHFDCPNIEIQMAYKMKVGVKDWNRRCSQGRTGFSFSL